METVRGIGDVVVVCGGAAVVAVVAGRIMVGGYQCHLTALPPYCLQKNPHAQTKTFREGLCDLPFSSSSSS